MDEMAQEGEPQYEEYTQTSTFVTDEYLHVDIPLGEQCPIEPDGGTTQDRVRSRMCRDDFIPDLKGRSYEEVQREAEKIQLGESFDTWYEFNRCLDSLGVLTGRGAAKYNTTRNFCVRVCKFGKVCRRHWRNTSSGQQQQEDYHLRVELPQADDLPKLDPAPTESLQYVHAREVPLVVGSAPTADSVLVDQRQAKTMVFLESLTPQIHREPLATLDANRNLTTQQSQVVDVNPGALSSVRSLGSRRPAPVVRHTRAWLPTRNPLRHGRRPSETGACGQLSRLLVHDPDHSTSIENDENVCPFRVRAQRLKMTGRIQITKADLRHTCPRFPHKWRGPSRKSQWMAVTLAPRVIRNTKIPVKEMLDGLSMDYHRTTVHAQMWRAKDQIRDWYLGGQRASVHRIPTLCQRLVDTDPQSIVSWCTAEDSSTFRRAFVCPSATRNALHFVQPMICLDACHTKNRKFPTQLFLATTLDGNSKVLILCYAIAEVENTDNWIWFLQQMRRALHGIDDIDLPILSDRQKGLLAAVREVFPQKVHAHCANHLRANVKKNFGKAAEMFFVALVYANSRAQFDELLSRLKKGATKGSAAVLYIEKLDPALWARHAFPLPRLGKVSSNPAEQANSGLLPIREFAPFKLMVELWHYISIQFKARRIKAGRARDTFTETAMLRHNVNLRHYQQWLVIDDGLHTAKVMSRDGVDEFLVKLHPRISCTCFELQEMLWPCEHIMAWDECESRDFNRHFNRCWKNSSLRSLYAPILPCFLVNDLLMSTDCYPPAIVVQKGRHRMVRIEGGQGGRLHACRDPALHLEADGQLFITYPVHDDPGVVEGMPLPGGSTNPRSEGQQGKRKSGPNVVQRKCGLCRGLGHNRRSCQLARHPNAPENANVQPEQSDVAPTPEEVILPLTASAPSTTQDASGEPDDSLNYSSSSDDSMQDIQQRQALVIEAEWGGGVVPVVSPNRLEYFVAESQNNGETEPNNPISSIQRESSLREWFHN